MVQAVAAGGGAAAARPAPARAAARCAAMQSASKRFSSVSASPVCYKEGTRRLIRRSQIGGMRARGCAPGEVGCGPQSRPGSPREGRTRAEAAARTRRRGRRRLPRPLQRARGRQAREKQVHDGDAVQERQTHAPSTLRRGCKARARRGAVAGAARRAEQRRGPAGTAQRGAATPCACSAKAMRLSACFERCSAEGTP
jgi:hypothetical protein